MREAIIEILKEKRKHHLISPGDFEAWLGNPITNRLFSDLEESLLYASDDIGGYNAEELAHSANRFCSYRSIISEIKDWKPDELVTNE